VHADLREPAALADGSLAGCDALVHAAGVTDEDFADRDAAFTKAVRGTSALLAAAKAAGIRRLVYFSSAHVYGPLEGRIDELRAPNPLSDYAIAHYAAEQLFRRAAMEPGVSALLVRPCAVYGMPPSLERFARWSLIPFDFPRQAVAGRIVLRSHGHQRRNFVPAEGLGHLLGWWLGQPAPGVTVANAPGRAECPVYEFAALCARIAKEECGREVAIERPMAGTAPPPPLEYRTRVGGHLPGTSLEDHVRALVRALSVKAPS
jgi:UDP-glucose 4-epimerase